MATGLRRSNAITSDTNAKFLYTILKQLDIKSINWQKVADDMDITNGHAARMRYTRFKQHTEGTIPGRKSRATNAEDRSKKKKATRAKRSKNQVKGEDDDEEEDTKDAEEGEGVVKREKTEELEYGEEDGHGEMDETYMYSGCDGAGDMVKRKVFVKAEPEERYTWPAGIGDREWTF